MRIRGGIKKKRGSGGRDCQRVGRGVPFRREGGGSGREGLPPVPPFFFGELAHREKVLGRNFLGSPKKKEVREREEEQVAPRGGTKPLVPSVGKYPAESGGGFGTKPRGVLPLRKGG